MMENTILYFSVQGHMRKAEMTVLQIRIMEITEWLALEGTSKVI